MNYFPLLCYFCIKYRLTLPVEGNAQIPVWQRNLQETLASLTDEQAKLLTEICTDNAKLIGKSPKSDPKTFSIVRERHLKKLKNLNYSEDEALQALPSYLKKEPSLSLVNTVSRFLAKNPAKDLSALPSDVINKLSEFQKEIPLKSPTLSSVSENELGAVLNLVKQPEVTQITSAQLSYIVAYGSKDDLGDALGRLPLGIDAQLVANPAHTGNQITLLQRAIQTGNMTNLFYLVEQGANLKKTDNSGNSLWHVVIGIKKNAQFISNLIEKNILDKKDINIKNQKGTTPLLLAAELARGRADITGMSYLLQCGADINEKDNNKNNIWHCAAHGKNLLLINELEKHNISGFDLPNNQLETPLHTALRLGNTKIARKLIEKGANIHLADNQGITPLHLITGYQFQAGIFPTYRQVSPRRYPELFDLPSVKSELRLVDILKGNPSKHTKRLQTFLYIAITIVFIASAFIILAAIGSGAGAILGAILSALAVIGICSLAIMTISTLWKAILYAPLKYSQPLINIKDAVVGLLSSAFGKLKMGIALLSRSSNEAVEINRSEKSPYELLEREEKGKEKVNENQEVEEISVNENEEEETLLARHPREEKAEEEEKLKEDKGAGVGF